MAPHLSNDEFFTSLSSLLGSTSSRSRGSVYLTQKRLSPPSTPTSDNTAAAAEEGSILIRATDGKTSNPNPKRGDDENKKVTKKTKAAKKKISTVVAPADLEAFYARYADVCKAGMTGMKKRDRSAKKKGKAKKGTSSAAAAGGKATKA